MKTHKPDLSDEMIEAIAARFRLLGEPVRLRLIRALERGEKTVNDLAADTAATQSNVSRHLNALYEGGLVDRRREGNNIYYSIGDSVVLDICALVCGEVREDALGRLSALAGRRR